MLRGPASVLYGEGAIGGVINVVPKRPTDYFTAEGEVAYGTDNTKRFGVGAGGPVSNQLAYRLDASGTQSDGWLDPGGRIQQAGPVRSRHLQADERSEVHAVERLRRPVADALPRHAADQRPHPNPLRFTNFNVRRQRAHFRDNWTQLKTEWAPSDWFSVRNVAYRLTSKRHWRNAEWYDYNDATGQGRTWAISSRSITTRSRSGTASTQRSARISAAA